MNWCCVHKIPLQLAHVVETSHCIDADSFDVVLHLWVTKYPVIGWFSAPYCKLRTPLLRRSIQFPRNIINILLTSFCLSMMKFTKSLFSFSSSIHGFRAFRTWAINWSGKNEARNLQEGRRTRLVRGTYDIYVGANPSAHEVDPCLFLRFLVPCSMFHVPWLVIPWWRKDVLFEILWIKRCIFFSQCHQPRFFSLYFLLANSFFENFPIFNVHFSTVICFMRSHIQRQLIA